MFTLFISDVILIKNEQYMGGTVVVMVFSFVIVGIMTVFLF